MNNNKNRIIFDIFIPLKGRSGSKLEIKKEFMNSFFKYISNNRKTHLPLSPYYFKLGAKINFNFYGKCNNDIDNLLKSLFDSLQQSKIIKNDNLIKKIEVEILENSIFEGISLSLYKY